MAITTNDFLFAIAGGGTVDLVRNAIPNLSSPSPIWLEKLVGDTLELVPVKAGLVPSGSDGIIVLEPARQNLITYNGDLSFNGNEDISGWEKGSGVVLRSKAERSADGSPSGADTITWIPGTGVNQLIRRTFLLRAQGEYWFSGILQAKGNTVFGPEDEIRFSGNLQQEGKISLGTLNEFPGKWRPIAAPILVGGDRPSQLPEKADKFEQQTGFVVTAVTASTFTISGANELSLNTMKGAIARFDKVANKSYRVAGNTASSAGLVTVTILENTLVSDGVTTTSKSFFEEPPPIEIVLEMYSESVGTIVVEGFQLEEGKFRTSIIRQREESPVRAQTELVYPPRENPVIELSTYGCFVDLAFWRGDGNIISGGNWGAEIANGRLSASFGSSALDDPDPLPPEVKLFFQVSEEFGTASLYVNGILKAKTAVTGFEAAESPLRFTSDGVRGIRSAILTGRSLTDGRPEVGGKAVEEVLEMFGTPIPADLIASSDPLLMLPTTRIPARVGEDKGRTLIRFPVNFEDTQTILEVDEEEKQVRVAATLGFKPQRRAIVQTEFFESIDEVIVTAVDNTGLLLTLQPSNPSGGISHIKVGHRIGQPKEGEETTISPFAYEIFFLENIPGVEWEQKYGNGFVVTNDNFTPKTVVPFVRVGAL